MGRAERIRSPNESIQRTSRAVFETPVIQSSTNLIRIGRRLFQNPIYLAREWRKALNNSEYASAAALARHLNISRARVTQILNPLHLSPPGI